MAAGITSFNKRIIHRNPLEPYSWKALYKRRNKVELAQLKQFDHDGYHYTREIDRQRLRRLVILGHPQSPIYVDPVEKLGPPDEVLIGARCQIQLETGYTGTKEKTATVYFGFRYGLDEYLVEVYPDGTVWKVLREPTTKDLDGRPVVTETVRGRI